MNEAWKRIHEILNNGHECRPMALLVQCQLEGRAAPSRERWLAARYGEQLIGERRWIERQAELAKVRKRGQA